MLRLLFVDNAHTDYTLLVRFIELGGYRLQSARVETAQQMRAALSDAAWDAVLSELDLPGFKLAQIQTVLRESGLDMPFIVVTASGSEDAAVEALVAGADDYVSKTRLARLLPALQRSIAVAAARRQTHAELVRLRLLRSHLDEVNEVGAVARDLHDTFGELMDELAADIAWLSGSLTDEAGGARVQNLQQAFERARERAQRGMRALRPPLLQLGIVQALRTQAQTLLQRHGIACAFAANRPAITMDEASFFVMYRVCQQALVLFARSHHTRSVHIELFAQAGSVTLEVADDGTTPDAAGFSRAAFCDLHEAVATLGGLLEVSSPPRSGTSIILSLPLVDAV